MSGEYKYVKISIARRRQWLNSFKDKPCHRCGASYPPYVMDFHHRKREEKNFNISQTSFRKGRVRLLEEMAKCDLLCSNCHRIVEHEVSIAVKNGHSILSHKQDSVGPTPTPATISGDVRIVVVRVLAKDQARFRLPHVAPLIPQGTQPRGNMKIGLSDQDRELLFELRRKIMTFADSIAKLDADVKALIAAVGPAATATAVAAAVAAKDVADATAVDAVAVQVVAATPVPAPVV